MEIFFCPQCGRRRGKKDTYQCPKCRVTFQKMEVADLQGATKAIKSTNNSLKNNLLIRLAPISVVFLSIVRFVKSNRTLAGAYFGLILVGLIAFNPIREMIAVNSMKTTFESVTFDPDASKFKELKVFLHVPTSDIRSTGSDSSFANVVCGQVNVKNRFGGYVGFNYFYWDSDSGEIFGLSNDSKMNSYMQLLAKKTCDKLLGP